MAESSPFDALGINPAERAALVDFVQSWEQHGGPLLFVGSGMSRFQTLRKPGTPDEVEIADWDKLIRDLLSLLPQEASEIDGKALDHLGVAQSYADRRGRRRIVDELERAIPYRRFDPGEAYLELVRFRWAAGVTTNYDDFLERSYEIVGRPLFTMVRDTDLSKSHTEGAIQIVKMHGSLDQPETIVLSAEDYDNYAETRPMLQNHVRLLVARHPMLFLGFSLRDPNVEAMLDWVAEKSHGFALPSVALIHSPPLQELAAKCAERRLELVTLPKGRTVADFLRALYAQWRPRPQPRHRSAEKDSPVVRLRRALEARQDKWLEVVAGIVAELVRAEAADDLHDAVYRLLHGKLHSLTKGDIEDVLDLLEESARYSFFMTAIRSGVPKGFGRDGGVIDVEQRLLSLDAPTSQDRAEVLVLRAERLEREGLLENSDLVAASNACARTPPTHWIRSKLRSLLLRAGDEELISSVLLTGPVTPNDAFAYARRGMDVLMTQGRDASRSWYEQALALAQNCDEKTAALYGMQACDPPGEWREMSEIEPAWQSIRDGKRPGVDAISDLEDEAGAELLTSYGGRNAQFEVMRATEHLADAVVKADEMGWPRSPSPNFTTRSDTAGYRLAGLLLREGGSVDDLKRGLATYVERGLLQVEGRLPRHVVTRVLDEVDVSWTRGLLRIRQEPPYMSRTRALLRSALLPVLPDSDIEHHLEQALDLDALAQNAVRETTDVEIHAELLNRSYHVIPRRAALQLLRLLTRVLSDRSLHFSRRMNWVRLPVRDWTITGVVEVKDEGVRDLTEALVQGFTNGTLTSDSFVERNVVRLLEELIQAGAIPVRLKKRLVQGLDDQIQRGIEADADVSKLLTRVLVRHDSGPLTPDRSVCELFLRGYARLRNSTAAGTWVNLVDVVGPHLKAKERAEVAKSVHDYVELTLRADSAPVLGPFPDWAATAVHQGVTAKILTPADGWNSLLRLAKVYPECIPRALEIPEANIGEAEGLLLAGLAGGRITSDALLQWCIRLPDGNEPRHDLEQALLGQVFSSAVESKQHAYWSLAWLAKKGSLSPESTRVWRRSVLKHGVEDSSWKVRAAAIVGAAKATNFFDDRQLDDLVDRADADPIAGVRRAGEALKRAQKRK